MKKLFTILIVTASIYSCGSAQKASTATSPDSVPVGEAIPEVVSVPVGGVIPSQESVPVGSAIPTGDSVPVGGVIPTEESVPVGASIPEKVSPARQQWLAEDQAIRVYTSKNMPTAEWTSSGIYYVKTKKGYGAKPKASSNVTVNYVGKFLDGTVFDQGTDTSFPLNRVIAGWTEGLQLLNKGGSITMVIPSYLAYGAGGRPGIPANSILVFDVDLIEVQ